MSNSNNEANKRSENKSVDKNKDESSKKSQGKSKTKDRFGFGNPVRILIVEPKGNYCKTVWCAIGIGMSHILIGAITMTMLIHSMKTEDTHVSMCTFAYHFFSAEAILSLNYANGWSSPMRLRHRRFTHVFLQMCAMACAITGTALISISKGISDSAHGITGIVTTVLAGITFLSGPCALFGGRYLKILHVSVGMPTFLFSSICLCLGVSTSVFQNWAGATVVYILVVFVTFYTTFIIVTCFMKCVMRI